MGLAKLLPLSSTESALDAPNALKKTDNQNTRHFLSIAKLMVLAVALVLFSFVYHLPASWVWQQVNTPVPKPLQLTMWQGSVWQGEVEMSWQTSAESVSLGSLRWHFNPWALVKLEGQVALEWSYPQGGSRADVSLNVLSGELIHVSAWEGRLPLPLAAKLLPVSQRLPGEVKGNLAIDIDALEWNLSKRFFESFNGQLEATGVNAMGIEVPQLKLMPTMQNQQLLLSLNGGSKEWRLNGEVRLDRQRYDANLNIKADSDQNMPPWTDLIMRKTSPVEAVLKRQGQW